MRITATAVSLLLTATLVAGCGDSDEETNAGEPSSESTVTTSDSGTASTPPDADLGAPVERPGYGFNLPRGWVDSTQDQSMADPEDAYGSVAADADHRLTVDVELDVSQELFDHGLSETIGRMKSAYASSGKELADTTWAGETAVHVQGRGQTSGTRAQVFYLRHDDASYIISVQTPGGRKQNEAAVDAVRSSWTWE